MKTTITLILMMFCLVGWGQGSSGITIEPSKGNRISLFFDGKVFDSDLYSDLIDVPVFVLKVFSDEERQSVWIQNFYLSEVKFKALMKHIDSLDKVYVSGWGESAPKGTNDYKLSSFHIYTDSNEVDIFYNKKG